MTRIALEFFVFFIAPFLGFAGWLLWTGRPVMSKESWQGRGGQLTICGVALVIVAILWLGFSHRSETGVYEPPRLENGVLVPGRIRPTP